MTTGRPPAPIPQEPADPTARISLELPLLFQPHVDLEKTSGGGVSTEEAAAPSNVNSISQSQDSEAAGFEAITAEEPFRGYSFEVSSPTHAAFCVFPEVVPSVPSVPFPRVSFVSKATVMGSGADRQLPSHYLTRSCRNYGASPIQTT